MCVQRLLLLFGWIFEALAARFCRRFELKRRIWAHIRGFGGVFGCTFEASTAYFGDFGAVGASFWANFAEKTPFS